MSPYFLCICVNHLYICLIVPYNYIFVVCVCCDIYLYSFQGDITILWRLLVYLRHLHTLFLLLSGGANPSSLSHASQSIPSISSSSHTAVSNFPSSSSSSSSSVSSSSPSSISSSHPLSPASEKNDSGRKERRKKIDSPAGIFVLIKEGEEEEGQKQQQPYISPSKNRAIRCSESKITKQQMKFTTDPAVLKASAGMYEGWIDGWMNLHMHIPLYHLIS